ncbi:MAG TPA: hypothetical protein DCD98_07190 [Syntrophomonas sp.]|jgi:hypothetical protein|nr:hypothetical protein [Syntrophomonas sp.]
MSKKLMVLLITLAMVFCFNVSVLAVDTSAAVDVDTSAIYGEQSNTKVYESPINLNEIITDMEVQPMHISLGHIITDRFTSVAWSDYFYVSNGIVRVEYGHYASTNGTVTAKLVKDNGAESMPITISGTAGQWKLTTLNWSQVPTGNWRLKLTLSPTAPASNPWSVRCEIWDS